MAAKFTPDVLFDFIVTYKRANDGNSPTMQAIMDNLGIRSKSHVSRLLDALEGQGKIERREHGMIIVTGGVWNLGEFTLPPPISPTCPWCGQSIRVNTIHACPVRKVDFTVTSV